jgi:PadR family transcriptional regulator, regulatory protein PadR
MVASRRPAATVPAHGRAGAFPRADAEPRNFLQCCVLLLLRERPAHGYELLERLKPFGIADGDPGNLYRRLRSLEKQGMVRSEWEMSGAGPRRRKYHLTTSGDARLRRWADSLAETRRVLDYYLSRHALVAESPASVASVPPGPDASPL